MQMLVFKPEPGTSIEEMHLLESSFMKMSKMKSSRLPPLPTPLGSVSNLLRHATFLLGLSWDFIESDFITFAIPNTAFGVVGAVASAALVDGPVSLRPSLLQIILRLPNILAFNIANLLVFDLANQRSSSSVIEDRINKPWRPIPQVSTLSFPFRMGFLRLYNFQI